VWEWTAAQTSERPQDIPCVHVNGQLKHYSTFQSEASPDRYRRSLICILSLRFRYTGAGLFRFCSLPPQPTTPNVLHQYALHALDSAAASARNTFSFSRRPKHTLTSLHPRTREVGQLGKIGATRDGFDASISREAWQYDFESGVSTGSEAGAQKPYAALVHDQGPNARAFRSTQEQAFLANIYDESARRAKSDSKASRYLLVSSIPPLR
jgi:hypothetical protein